MSTGEDYMQSHLQDYRTNFDPRAISQGFLWYLKFRGFLQTILGLIMPEINYVFTWRMQPKKCYGHLFILARLEKN